MQSKLLLKDLRFCFSKPGTSAKCPTRPSPEDECRGASMPDFCGAIVPKHKTHDRAVLSNATVVTKIRIQISGRTFGGNENKQPRGWFCDCYQQQERVRGPIGVKMSTPSISCQASSCERAAVFSRLTRWEGPYRGSWIRGSEPTQPGGSASLRSRPRIATVCIQSRCPLSGGPKSCLNVPNGEGFRMPAGVRKPLMQEPAGHSRRLWGFRSAVDVGDGAAATRKRRDGRGLEALLRHRAVLSALRPARRDPVGGASHHRRAQFRCRKRSACGLKLDNAMPGHGAFSRFRISVVPTTTQREMRMAPLPNVGIACSAPATRTPRPILRSHLPFCTPSPAQPLNPPGGLLGYQFGGSDPA